MFSKTVKPIARSVLTKPSSRNLLTRNIAQPIRAIGKQGVRQYHDSVFENPGEIFVPVAFLGAAVGGSFSFFKSALDKNPVNKICENTVYGILVGPVVGFGTLILAAAIECWPLTLVGLCLAGVAKAVEEPKNKTTSEPSAK